MIITGHVKKKKRIKYDIIIPTAPSPTTTHLIVCIVVLETKE
jgi:hypothetical protein